MLLSSHDGMVGDHQAQGLFLVAAGLFNVVVWPRFAMAIVGDDRAWTGEHWHSAPTSFFWVHAVLDRDGDLVRARHPVDRVPGARDVSLASAPNA